MHVGAYSMFVSTSIFLRINSGILVLYGYSLGAYWCLQHVWINFYFSQNQFWHPKTSYISFYPELIWASESIVEGFSNMPLPMLLILGRTSHSFGFSCITDILFLSMGISWTYLGMELQNVVDIIQGYYKNMMQLYCLLPYSVKICH